jgi:hypothetical protein
VRYRLADHAWGLLRAAILLGRSNLRKILRASRLRSPTVRRSRTLLLDCNLTRAFHPGYA